ncbi:hypothetical protein BDF20DRAFT_820428, partial [Mycotypha africana]|uniref:uncharacterized protein n=1 Tax=Mycotypha africana TaxID=64632 RepID=UPI00230105F1
PCELATRLNCLLYADDVVLIANRRHLQHLLHLFNWIYQHQCENHSYALGYRWHPDKCVILDPHNDPMTYSLYESPLRSVNSFPYLGVPFHPGGYVDPNELIRINTTKALATMDILSSIGLNNHGFENGSSILCSNDPASTRVWCSYIYSMSFHLRQHPQTREGPKYLYSKDLWWFVPFICKSNAPHG